MSECRQMIPHYILGKFIVHECRQIILQDISRESLSKWGQTNGPRLFSSMFDYVLLFYLINFSVLIYYHIK